MYYRGKYMDFGDGHEMGLKRQRLLEEGSSYFGTSPTSSFMYNPPPPPAYSYVGQPSPFPVVRLRGLPFDCSDVDIVEFLHGLDIVDILFVHKGGKFMGEAFVVLGYPPQVDLAVQRNRHNIGRRYVEVFRSKRQEYYKAIANEFSETRGGSPHRAPKFSEERKDLAEHTGILRLRGLPYSVSKNAIMDFFRKFVISEDAIHITLNLEGRPTGEAFVKFASPEESRAAMVKDRMTLGYRYIELFPSSQQEMNESISTGKFMVKSGDGNERTEMTHVLRMRGLPYSAGKEDIIDFFKDFGLSEDSIHVSVNVEGRSNGEAFVEFANAEDAKAALVKDRMTLGSRYIELFPSSLEELNGAVSRGER